jgi:AsmA protein
VVRGIKIFAILVGAIIVLTGALFLFVFATFDPNAYKGELVAEFQERTGRTLRIDQPVHLSFFPWVGVETGGIVVGNAEGFGDEPFAQIDRLVARVKLLPLLERRFEVDTLVFEGVHVNLMRDATGKTNWSDLGATRSSVSNHEQETKEAALPVVLTALKVQGIELHDAQLRWVDHVSGTRWVFEHGALETGVVAIGTPIPLQGRFAFRDPRSRLSATVAFRTTLHTDRSLARFRLTDFSLTLMGTGPGLSESGETAEVVATVAGDRTTGTVEVTGLRVKAAGAELTGQASVRGLPANPQGEGTLTLAETDLKALAARFGAPIVTADPDALKRIRAQLTFHHSGKTTRIEPLTLQVDSVGVRGTFQVQHAERPVVRARFAIDPLDLDRYLPPQPEARAESPSRSRARGSERAQEATAPFAALRVWDGAIDFKIARLRVRGMQLDDVAAHLEAQRGRLTVAPLTASGYEGKLDARLIVDARQSTPHLRVAPRWTGIQIAPLLRDLFDQDWLSGTGNLDFDLQATGLDATQWQRTLRGKGVIRLTDGAYKGLDLVKMVRTALRTRSNVRQTGEQGDRTEFTELTGSFVAQHGVITNRDLVAKSPLFRLQGKGMVDLPARVIDYTVTVKLVASLEGQGGPEAEQLKGIPIPVRIQGPLEDPRYALDIETLLTQQAKQKVRDQVEDKVTRKLEEKLQGPLGGALKGLLGR